ncbi:Purine nucleoside phosphorylase 1 [Stieleria neptunia]|uniref:purine-nucleoside phosphorylase n=1 Tax=Stieleria neptunia TaxID=2527979 RepID=A0A518HPD5_9BACT|nr:purine-nucleoside phosphorylase [Stieleria neptunia]QDV42637.1 Purine nucleoside phosphorylase 1 [Stieleria neptunia]
MMDQTPSQDASVAAAVAMLRETVAPDWEYGWDAAGQTPMQVAGQAPSQVAGQAPSQVAGQAPAPTITAIVLGSGLGSLADKIESPVIVPFGDIPGFAHSTASGHRGQLVFGTLGGEPLIAMAGRLHRYEGWTDDQVTFPIRVMQGLGARRLIASNAAGGVNPKLAVGDIVVLCDQINWLHARRQIAVPDKTVPDKTVPSETGAASAGFTIGFPAGRRGQLFDPQLVSLALSAAREGGFVAVQGTYLATLGPTYETRAEYRMMRRIGADVVGMSTAGEVLMAANLGMSVLALSIVSNVADPDRAKVADHAEVLEAGDAAAAKLEGIVRRILSGHRV